MASVASLLALVGLALTLLANPFCLLVSAPQLSDFGREPLTAYLDTSSRRAAVDGGVDLLFVGDIMLGRVVKEVVRAKGDHRSPFLQVADQLRAADLTIANVECALTDALDPPYDPTTYSLVARTESALGLSFAGVDAVTLANNHTSEFGASVMLDTLKTLEARAIVPFGMGRDFQQAHQPAVLWAGRLRVALLGYSDLFVGGEATSKSPGLSYAREDQIRQDIASAAKLADLVIPYFHWGDEYTADPNSRQKQLAHLAVDAGASAVIGSHPHWVQAIEMYRGRPIVYSLGNFVFDQNWSIETRQGMVAHLLFQPDGQFTGLRLLAVRIDDHYQPRFLGLSDSRPILERVAGASARLNNQN